MPDPRSTDLLRGLWRAGLAAVDPEVTVPPHLPPQPEHGRFILFALGKAAASMAEAACRHRRFDGGLVIAPHGTVRSPGLPAAAAFLTAAHPVPDDASLRAGEDALRLLNSLRAEDRLVALISGGGSALMAAPVPGTTLADKQEATRRLLASGAPIADINRIRVAFSRVKGGGLLAACGTGDVSLIVMSDVPGDDGRLVASGPFSPDAWPMGAARAAAGAHGIALPNRHEAPGKRPPPAPRICANSGMALAAAAREAVALGYIETILGDGSTGDAEALASEHIALALRQPGGRRVWLSGGEASVRVAHPGAKGGRNLAYALAAAIALDGVPDIAVLAADSDGIDGNSDAAGAIVDGTSAAAMRATGLDPAAMLRANRSLAALEAVGATLRTGPTGVNVNDFRAIVRTA